MRNSLVVGIGMIIMMGFILVSCTNMERTNVFDPGADYYVPPPPPPLTISPAGVQTVKLCAPGNTIQYTAAGGTPPYTWSVIDKVCTEVNRLTVSQTGLFSVTNCPATVLSCKVRVTDLAGVYATSGVISAIW